MYLPRVKPKDVPAFIKCDSCRQKKNKSAYNTKNVQILMKKTHNIDRKPGEVLDVLCNACCPQQVTELQCAECDKWKGLVSFSKAQRRERDDAKCLACIKIQLETAPAGEESDDESGEDSSDSNAYYSDDEVNVLATTATQSAASTRGPAQGGTIWTGRSATSAADAVQTTTASTAAYRPPVARSVASSVAGGVAVPAVNQQVVNPGGRYISDSESEEYSDSDEEDGWMDRTSTILSCDMQLGLE